MNKLNLGLIGYGNVGTGLVQLLKERRSFIRQRFNIELVLKTICDRSIHKKKVAAARSTQLTTDVNGVLRDHAIDVVVELIGGLNPTKEIAFGAIRNNKHLVTANKELIAEHGKELFKEAIKRNRNVYFEASVGAGIPIINAITDGVAGNKFNGLYGIINGTCNFILSEMTKTHCSFAHALKEAQKRGYAESNPTKDINGMDSVHKLAILTFLTTGKFVKPNDIFVEGITNIDHLDIEFADTRGLIVKLLAIAKKVNNEIEIRVHPTMIPRKHPLASVNGIFNAIFLNTDPVGDILLYGQGAGQMTAASGVMSDLINLAVRPKESAAARIENLSREFSGIKLRKMDQVETKFYIRFMAVDRPGVLAAISGVLGKYGISISSLNQKIRHRSSAVPIYMLTHPANEKMVRLALEKIAKLQVVKGYPVAIRMENLS